MMKTQDRGQVPKRRQTARRYRAGLFEAEGAYADSMVRTAMGDIKGAIEALRMALEWLPDYAPAIFSLGTVEYQRGKRDEGRRLFQLLLAQPTGTPDLVGIIDDAGDFLIARHAYDDGLEWYRAAASRYPDVGVFHQGVGCCAGNKGFHEEAIDASQRALVLEPSNQEFVNDLGWSFLEAGQLSEAERVLTRAVAMDPADALAAENLRFCKSKVLKATAAKLKATAARPKATAASSKVTAASPKATAASPKVTAASPKVTAASPKATAASPKVTAASPKSRRRS